MSKPKIKSIQGKKILLEPFSTKFVSNKYLSWMNDKKVTEFIEKSKDKITLDDITLFANQMIHSEKDYFFAILLKNDLSHIGNVRLGPIDFNSKKSGFGILIGEKNLHGKGLGTEVMELIKEFSFNYLQLKKLSFPVAKDHLPAMKLYSKTGFKCLGDKGFTLDKNGKTWKLVEWTINNPLL